MEVNLIRGDATQRWPLGDCSLDSIVTDPPYGIAFMGKSWDDKGGPLAYQQWTAKWASEAYRCLKPGGFLLAFGATRMAHRMTCGFEDVGFEILDTIEWIYLSGMPKAQDIGKMFDKKNGSALAFEEEAERFGAYLRERRAIKVLSKRQIDDMLGLNTSYSWWEGRKGGVQPPSKANYLRLKPILDLDNRFDEFIDRVEAEREKVGEVTKARSEGAAFAMPTLGAKTEYQTWDITAPATDLAKQWDGWKTPSLKPSHEPVVVARKPLIGTYCENIERWGVGAINVDACRVSASTEDIALQRRRTGGIVNEKNSAGVYDGGRRRQQAGNELGRFPANVVISHGPDCTEEACMEGCPVAVLDGQSGILHARGNVTPTKRRSSKEGWGNKGKGPEGPIDPGESGGASKVFAKFFYEAEDFAGFYYCPKASTKERNEGCSDLPEREARPVGLSNWEGQTNGNGEIMGPSRPQSNFHPTVKPLKLVQYLQRLVTPPGGTTGSPFLGSGTDAVAAILEGFDFWGMNLPDRPGEEYWPIIEARVAHALKEAEKPAETKKPKTKAQPQQKPESRPNSSVEQARLF